MWPLRSEEAQETLWRVGITGVHDFDRKRCFQAIQLLREKGELRLRILKSIPLEDMPHAAALGISHWFWGRMDQDWSRKNLC